MAKDDDPLLEDYLSMDQALSQIEEIAHADAPQQLNQAAEISEWYQRTPTSEYDRGEKVEQQLEQPNQQNYQPTEVQHFGEIKEKKWSLDP